MITRIRELLEARQLSPTQFADLIGVGRPVISHILSERNKPSLEVVQKIISAFPDISLPWLLAGTGPMLAAAAAAPAPTAPIRPAEVVQQPIAVAPPVPAPIPTTPTATPRSPRPAAFERPAPTVSPQASSYPQPPKFRPGVAASATSASFGAASPPEVSAPVSVPDPIPTAAMPTAAALPGQPPLSAPTATLSAVSLLSPPLPTESLSTAGSPAPPAAEVPTLATPTSPELAAPDPHPAAALSFLGEPGKAIRRIVIFYRDGSFSDYLPDGN
ncbi:helix-turn-helix domain-containing protein [Hymenobacter bucti]|uniref:Helix-turn-helix domain-containing protein n=1 Tax=Hymenobacter bucti TaxID=1844114 RepID=A0ABW4R155_9BACT